MLQAVADLEPVVSSYNEWDPLEEVIVGIADHACVPAWHVALQATMPRISWPIFARDGGKPFPREVIAGANRDLDEFAHILEAEGVTVRRPEPVDFSRPFATPDWASPGGLYAAMPRDILLVIGEEIIESPMSWRCRQNNWFTAHAGRLGLTSVLMDAVPLSFASAFRAAVNSPSGN